MAPHVNRGYLVLLYFLQTVHRDDTNVDLQFQSSAFSCQLTITNTGIRGRIIGLFLWFGNIID